MPITQQFSNKHISLLCSPWILCDRKSRAMRWSRASPITQTVHRRKSWPISSIFYHFSLVFSCFSVLIFTLLSPFSACDATSSLHSNNKTTFSKRSIFRIFHCTKAFMFSQLEDTNATELFGKIWLLSSLASFNFTQQFFSHSILIVDTWFILATPVTCYPRENLRITMKCQQ